MIPLFPTETAADDVIKSARVAILPVGSFEQHGEYLPLITDTIVACAISRAIADVYPVALLPPITVSCSHEHSAWRGTASISARTLYSLVTDVHESISRSGLQILVVVNGHGGNYVLSNVVQEANAVDRKMALFPARDNWQTARNAAGLVSTMHEDMHGGEAETSILLHSSPELVHEGYRTRDHIANDRRHMLTVGVHAYTPHGIIGRPSLATPEKGKAMLDSLAQEFRDIFDLFSKDCAM